MIAFGLGSGRCGTLSLARLFRWRHEPYRGDILWGTGAEPLLDELMMRDESSVHSGFLGYVPYILLRRPDARFICLKRDKEETVQSFHNVTKHEVNPWDPRRPEESYLDIRRSLPKYPYTTKDEAIRQYYDDYYALAEYFAEVFGNVLRIFPTEYLSIEDGQREMADWVGVKYVHFLGPVHVHRSVA